MPHNKLSTEDYDHLVEGWIVEAFSGGHNSFAQLLRALPGVYPSIVRDALVRLMVDHPQLADLFLQTEQNPLVGVDNESHWTTTLPTPHPLDYDWRFTDRAITYLLDICHRLATPGEQIALLGTPTVFHAALELHSPYCFTLLENNPTMIAALVPDRNGMTAVRCHLARDPLPELTASVVIADPPWYEDEIQVFLWVARRLCIDSGYVLLSVPPLGTRPGIAVTWTRVITWAEQIGLQLRHLEPGVLPYETPPFERNALLADGVPSTPSTWRHGDLAVFVVVGPCTAARPLLPLSDDCWDEIGIHGIRIRLRQQQDRCFRDPTLRPLIHGDVLPSISRRDPRRGAVDVWTSGNRVFSCCGTHIAGAIVSALARGLPPGDVVASILGRPLHNNELQQVDHTTEQLSCLVACERHETKLG